jgi:cell division protein ZipA
MELRWGLLLVGLAVITAVYLYSRYRPRDNNRRSVSGTHRREPVLATGDKTSQISSPSESSGRDTEPLVSFPADFTDPRTELGPDPIDALVDSERVDQDRVDEELTAAGSGIDAASSAESKVIAIRLMSRSGRFPADKLILALREAGLRHGQFGIFHRSGIDEQATEFSVANLTEPGTFDLTRVKTDYYPGVSIFMMLPGPDDGVDAFDDMLMTSRSLADKLNGELLDEQGSSLSMQRERYLREEVVQFQLEHQ